MAQPPGNGSSINRDLGTKIKHVAALTCILGNNNTEGTGTGVDLKGYEGAQVVFNVGDSGDTLSGSLYLVLSVEHSDEAAANFTALNATTQIRSEAGANLTIDAPAEDTAVFVVNVLPCAGVKRYIRPMVTFTGTHTNGIPISATVAKGFPRVETT